MTTPAQVPPKTPPDHIKTKLVFAGQRRGACAKPRLVQVFVGIKDDGTVDVDERRIYDELISFPSPMIGAVYDVVISDKDGGAFGSKTRYAPKYLHYFEDEGQVRTWQLEERTDVAQYKVDVSAKAEAWGDLVEKCLEPLRKAYYATNTDGQRVIKMFVLEYLERDMPKGFGRNKGDAQRRRKGSK